MKKKLFITLAIVVLIAVGAYAYMYQFYCVPILTYHYVNDNDPHNTSVVTEKAFTKHMEYIYKHGYDVITLDQLVEAIKANKKLAHNKVVITFDDGYADNYFNAFPILKKYKFSAIIFLAVGEVFHKPYMLSSNEVRHMKENNITFGAHAIGLYDYLPDFSQEKLIEAVQESKKIIEKQTGRPVYYFAYPLGGYTTRVQEVVKDAGFKGAVATNRGMDRLNRDIFALRRIKMTNRDANPLSMWVKLSGFYNILRRSKSPD